MRKIILIALVLSLSGCAQIQRQHAEKRLQEAYSICQSAFRMPELAPTRKQIPNDAKDATVEQLSDASYMRPDQKNAVVHREGYLSMCHDEMKGYLSQYAPGAVPIYEQEILGDKVLLAQLASGKITFGEFNTQRAKSHALAQSIAQQAESNRAMQAQQLYLQRQQAILNSQNIIRNATPRTATCTRFGNTVNCVGE